MPEKSIPRLTPSLNYGTTGGMPKVVMKHARGGRFVYFSDHQQALGEARTRAATVAGETAGQLMREAKAEVEAANQKLQAITAALEAEVDRLRKKSERNVSMVHWAHADRLQEILDQAETAAVGLGAPGLKDVPAPGPGAGGESRAGSAESSEHERCAFCSAYEVRDWQTIELANLKCTCSSETGGAE